MTLLLSPLGASPLATRYRERERGRVRLPGACP